MRIVPAFASPRLAGQLICPSHIHPCQCRRSRGSLRRHRAWCAHSSSRCRWPIEWHPAAGKWCVKEVIGHLIEEDQAAPVSELRGHPPGLLRVEHERPEPLVAHQQARAQAHRSIWNAFHSSRWRAMEGMGDGFFHQEIPIRAPARPVRGPGSSRRSCGASRAGPHGRRARRARRTASHPGDRLGRRSSRRS